jgi:hypothetical protein
MLGVRNLFRVGAAVALLAGTAVCGGVMPANPPTVEELKARVNSASVADRPPLCVQIAERQLEATDKLYAAVETEKAQATLADVVAFSEEARDFAIQSHKHQKQIEIAVRRMTRKLNDIKRTVSREEQVPLDNAIDHLQRVRDDLLTAMFPKGAK